MFMYGFELEGFYLTDGNIGVPPKDFPTDGFAGLCEVRTQGAGALEDQYFNLLQQYSLYGFCTDTSSHRFTPSEKANINSRGYVKGGAVVSNIYGKPPKDLRGLTIASLQINISYRLSRSFTTKEGVTIPEKYALFDPRPIVERLDKAFEQEIMQAGRQLGMYSIKDYCRLEYRSLPNSVFTTELKAIPNLLEKIRVAVEQ